MANKLVFRIKNKDALVKELTRRIMAYNEKLRLEKAVSAVVRARAVFASAKKQLEDEKQKTGRDPSDTALTLARQRMAQTSFDLLTMILALGGSQLSVENLDPSLELIKVFRENGALTVFSYVYKKRELATRILRQIHRSRILDWPEERIAGLLTTLRGPCEVLLYRCDLVAMHGHYFRFNAGKYEVLC